MYDTKSHTQTPPPTVAPVNADNNNDTSAQNDTKGDGQNSAGSSDEKAAE